MSLQPKLSYIAQGSKRESVIVSDSTGSYSASNQGGYGLPNKEIADIVSHTFVISDYVNPGDFYLRIDGSNPNFPSNAQIAAGEEITILVSDLSNSEEIENLKKRLFCDGVISLEMFVEFDEGFGSTPLVKGNDFVDGPDFTEAIEAGNIVSNGEFYEIDIAKSTTSKIYLTRSIVEDEVGFNVAYKGSTKALLQRETDGMYQRIVQKISAENVGVDSEIWKWLTTAFMFKLASVEAFNATPPNYGQSNELMESAFKILKKYC